MKRNNKWDEINLKKEWLLFLNARVARFSSFFLFLLTVLIERKRVGRFTIEIEAISLFAFFFNREKKKILLIAFLHFKFHST